jgi:hypothetical protein
VVELLRELSLALAAPPSVTGSARVFTSSEGYPDIAVPSKLGLLEKNLVDITVVDAAVRLCCVEPAAFHGPNFKQSLNGSCLFELIVPCETQPVYRKVVYGHKPCICAQVKCDSNSPSRSHWNLPGPFKTSLSRACDCALPPPPPVKSVRRIHSGLTGQVL